ncbi:MAG: pyridoxamine kinase [Ruminococcaceae bacterium]|nr:pyridoxamine kinase [Oscillospiraceae bacterium]
MSVNQKQIIAVNDISCIGRCSLTVALPVLSAAGIHTALLPTSLLSTHTGGFTGFTFLDLTEEMKRVLAHWETLSLSFDAVYSGYLGSADQVEIVEQVMRDYPGYLFVDPVMGDCGRYYTGFSDPFAKKMLSLCRKAHGIVPNVTEACMMLGEPYREPPFEQDYIDSILQKLAGETKADIVMTGVSFDKESVGCACLDRKSGKTDFIMRKTVEGYYHGTGDVFASSLLAALLNDIPLKDSAEIATDFTVASLSRTHAYGDDTRYGVAFEQEISSLLSRIEPNRGKRS